MTRVKPSPPSPSLPHEALLTFGVGNLLCRQDFYSDKAVRTGITGLLDDAHPALAQFLDNAVVRNALAGHWRESYVPETGKSMKATELAAAQEHCY
jgi:hypothetical protein